MWPPKEETRAFWDLSSEAMCPHHRATALLRRHPPAPAHVHAVILKSYFWLLGRRPLSLPLPQATRWSGSPFTPPPHFGAPAAIHPFVFI